MPAARPATATRALQQPRVGPLPPDNRLFGLLLLGISATGSLGGIALWLAGQGFAGLQAASFATLLILALLLA